MSQVSSPSPTDFLDRPVLGSKRITWWHVAYALLIVFILFTRLWDLSSRAYSHDESIHAWESWKLVTGQGYAHSPVYHGPFLYHFTALIFALFGHNDYTGRLGTALGGILITLLPFFLSKWLSKKGVLFTALLMAVSPVLMHRSRFIRHDHFAIVFNLVLFIAILRYLETRGTKDLRWVAAAISLGFAAKETTFITYFIFGSFLAIYYVWQLITDWRRHPKGGSPHWRSYAVFDVLVVMGTLILPTASPFVIRLLGRDPIDYTQQAIIFSGAVFLVVQAIAVAIGAWWNWKKFLPCLGIFYGIFLPLFTTMFTNGQGFATGMVGQLGYWLSQQDVARGGQPWYYYLVIMPLYEFMPILVGLGGTAYVAIRQIKRLFVSRQPVETRTYAAVVSSDGRGGLPLIVPFLIYWFFLAFAMYTWAGEKMPWLMMNLVTPLHILAGWTLAQLFDTDWAEIKARGGLWLLALVPIFLYALIRLVANRPVAGLTTEQLSQTMSWLTSLIVAVIAAIPIAVIAPRLVPKDAWRVIASSLLVVLLALTVRFAWMATFINADIATEFLVYAQGAPDDALVAHELENMSKRLTGGLHMKVAYDDDSSWPFVWYLRDFDNAQFYGKKPGGPFDAEVVIVGPGNESGVKPFLGNKYYRRQYRLIWWPNQDWYMNWTPKKLWADLKDPDARAKLWNVIFYRKHEASLTSWPFVHNFAMYVRRDIAQQLWDYEPDAVLTTGTLPGDEYIDLWQPRTASLVWGGQGSAPGQFLAPKGMAVDAQGEIYVADSQNHRIQVLDSNGQPLRQWGSQGNMPGQLNEPWSVAISHEGEVYVADTWNHRIQVFDTAGNYRRGWGIFGEVQSPSDSGSVLYGPRDVAIDADDNLYVTDTGNKRVIKYDSAGRMLGAIGGSGDGNGQFQEPVGLAIGPDGMVYVVDTWNQRIQVFGSDLSFVRSWPVYAWDGMSVVNKPYIAADAAGNVYVTDPEGYRVIQYSGEGKLLAVWGQFGSDASSMNLPTGLAVDLLGRVLVSDSENNRILIFGP